MKPMNGSLFTKCANLRDAYLNVRDTGTSRREFKDVMDQAVALISACNAEISEVYATGPKVHGVRQQSRLDLVSQWKELAERIFDSCETAMLK